MSNVPVIFTIKRFNNEVSVSTQQEGFKYLNKIVLREFLLYVLEDITRVINNEHNRAVLFEYEG